MRPEWSKPYWRHAGTANLGAGSRSFRRRIERDSQPSWAFPENELQHALEGASIAGDGPALRSVELVSSTGEMLSVRVGYEDRSFEIYRFVRVAGSLSIDSIERA